jgi:hypothetical protein
MLGPIDTPDSALPPITNVDNRQQPIHGPISARAPIVIASDLLSPRLRLLLIVGSSCLALVCYRLVKLVDPGEDLALVGF